MKVLDLQLHEVVKLESPIRGRHLHDHLEILGRLLSHRWKHLTKLLNCFDVDVGVFEFHRLHRFNLL